MLFRDNPLKVIAEEEEELFDDEEEFEDGEEEFEEVEEEGLAPDEVADAVESVVLLLSPPPSVTVTVFGPSFEEDVESDVPEDAGEEFLHT